MYLQYFGIIYGLLLGLLAVGAYQNHAETRRSVVAEAASLAVLYRDISEYPEPSRTHLRKLVREYARFTIDDAWPKQRQGIMPELSGPNPVAGILQAYGPVRTWHRGTGRDPPDGAQTVQLVY